MAARIDHGRAQLLTRTGLDWTEEYPSAVAALRNVKAGALLSIEIEDSEDGEPFRGFYRGILRAIRPHLLGTLAEATDRALASVKPDPVASLVDLGAELAELDAQLDASMKSMEAEPCDKLRTGVADARIDLHGQDCPELL